MSKSIKKPSKRSRKSRNKGVNCPPVPQTFQVSLASTYRWNTTVSAGSPTTAYANVSDLNEFQPYFYDQLMTIWKNFLVLRVEIEYRIVNRSGAYEGELIVFETPRKNYDAGISQPIAASVPGAQRYMITSTGANKALTIKRNVNLANFYKAGFKSDSDFWGDFYNAPPICSDTLRKDCMYSVLMYTAADGIATLQYTTDRRITYHCHLFNFVASNISFLTSEPASEDPESRPTKRSPQDCVNVHTDIDSRGQMANQPDDDLELVVVPRSAVKAGRKPSREPSGPGAVLPSRTGGR